MEASPPPVRSALLPCERLCQGEFAIPSLGCGEAKRIPLRIRRHHGSVVALDYSNSRHCFVRLSYGHSSICLTAIESTAMAYWRRSHRKRQMEKTGCADEALFRAFPADCVRRD